MREVPSLYAKQTAGEYTTNHHLCTQRAMEENISKSGDMGLRAWPKELLQPRQDTQVKAEALSIDVRELWNRCRKSTRMRGQQEKVLGYYGRNSG